MNRVRFNRRHLLKSMAAVAAPCVIPSSALGNAKNRPPASGSHWGTSASATRAGACSTAVSSPRTQSVAMADAYKDRREAFARCRQALRRFPRAAGPQRHRRRGRSPRPTTGTCRSPSRRPGAKKDAYVEKPLGVSIEQDLACPQGVHRKPAASSSTAPSSGARALPLRLRVGPQRADRQGPHDRSDRAQRRCGRIDREIAGTAELGLRNVARPRAQKPYTADRCQPPGTYWIYDYSIGYLGGWGAHPLDIMIWGSDADMPAR